MAEPMPPEREAAFWARRRERQEVLHGRGGRPARARAARPQPGPRPLGDPAPPADPDQKNKDGSPRFPELRGKRYRPENVLQFLACQPDLEAYLASIGLDTEDKRRLPDDIVERLAELRPRCAEHAAGRG